MHAEKSSETALVVFVKTPQFSVVKTRLATDLGEKDAEQFYKYSITAIEDLLEKLHRELKFLKIYWAIAEEPAINLPVWQKFENIYQGDAGLGDRLNRVYDDLLSKHGSVCIIGSDSPHLKYKFIRDKLVKSHFSSKSEAFLGEAEDGGFYYFSAKTKISKTLWNNISYSENTTAKQLINQFEGLFQIQRIEVNFDIDTINDFKKYQNIIVDNEFLPSQIKLFVWAQNIINRLN